LPGPSSGPVRVEQASEANLLDNELPSIAVPVHAATAHSVLAVGPVPDRETGVVALQPTDHAVTPLMRGKDADAVHSPVRVFSVHEGSDPVIGDDNSNDASLAAIEITPSANRPRADLLVGLPDAYAHLVLKIAAEEGVDPNWVLSILRAENAGFDPLAVSSAGAVGLMQVMPRIGTAFGADDLTDPEQNIRAGTRFLRVLIEKYRNPVLIASAYNAGEPRVDSVKSLPLIRETADYVTRVMGYYSGSAAISVAATSANRSSGSGAASSRRSGPSDRARSPMLVFSAQKLPSLDGQPELQVEPAKVGGLVNVVKEEVSR